MAEMFFFQLMKAILAPTSLTSVAARCDPGEQATPSRSVSNDAEIA